MIDLIVNKASDDLFNTPRPTVVPTDSFNEDFDINFIKEQEKDLKLDDIGTINKMLKTEGSLQESSKGGHSKGSKNSKNRKSNSKNRSKNHSRHKSSKN